MRLLLIITNTSATVTDTLVAAARRMVPSTITVVGATARFGARYITTRPTYAIAAHAALDAYAEHGRDADAVVIACFGDPGLLALRELAEVPVVGMAEASCRAAARQGRFAIVTGGVGWIAMLQEFVATLGLADRLAAVRAVVPTGGEIAGDPAASAGILAQECRAAVSENGADVVILGGAGLIGIADRIAPEVPVPVIDGLAAAVRSAQDILAEPSRGAGPIAPSVETIGLPDALATLLSGRRGEQQGA
jgi:allantoin racemase